MTKQKLWELIEAYRMSGGSEEHHARKEQLDAVLDGLLAQHDSGQAKPEPEPVAWMYVNTDGECEQIEYGKPYDDPSVTPLYTTPPQRKPLTEEQIMQLWSNDHDRVSFARAIEAAHGIKGGDTSPPQRTWVGLTDEEIQEIALELPMDAVRITEAKLKRKNGYAEEKNT